MSRCMFTIFVVLQVCVRAGTNKAACVSPSPWIQKCGHRGCCSCQISIALQSLHHLGTTELHQNDRSQRCGLLFATKKTCATAGLSASVATRGRSGGACVRPRSPACMGVRGLLFARGGHILLALWYVTPCYAPTSGIPCLCNTKNAGCCALVTVVWCAVQRGIFPSDQGTGREQQGTIWKKERRGRVHTLGK